MIKKPIHRISLPVPENVRSDLHSFMDDMSFADESTACLSLIIRALYGYEVDKLSRTPAPAARL